MFHIRCTSIQKLMYFNFVFASFGMTVLSAGIATPISMNVFSCLFLIIIYGLFAITLLLLLLLLLFRITWLRTGTSGKLL